MRRFFTVLVIVLIVIAVVAIIGPELPEDNFINGFGSAVRNVVGAIGESIGFSMRGFAS